MGGSGDKSETGAEKYGGFAAYKGTPYIKYWLI